MRIFSLLFILNLFIISKTIAQQPLINIHPNYNDTGTTIKPIDPQSYHNLIKTNLAAIFISPVPLLISEYRLVYEFTSGPYQSTYLGGSYLGKGLLFDVLTNSFNSIPNTQLNFIVNGFKVSAGHKFYTHSKYRYAPEGLYFSPRITYYQFIFTERTLLQYGIYLKMEHYDIVGLMGYQANLLNNFFIDIYMGMGYKKNKLLDYYGHGTYNVVDPRDVGLPDGNVKVVFGVNYGFGIN